MNDQQKKIMGVEIFLILMLALALGKKLSDAELEQDNYAKISMLAGALCGCIIWYVLEAQDNDNEKQLEGFDLIELSLLTILSSLLAQAARHSIPYLKDGAKNLIFSQRNENIVNDSLQEALVDNNPNNQGTNYFRYWRSFTHV